jgi:hypothetical protein
MNLNVIHRKLSASSSSGGHIPDDEHGTVAKYLSPAVLRRGSGCRFGDFKATLLSDRSNTITIERSPFSNVREVGCIYAYPKCKELSVCELTAGG